MVGMDIQFLPEIKHDNIFTKSKVGNWKISLHMDWKSHRLPEIKHDNIFTKSKVATGRLASQWYATNYTHLATA